MKKVLFIIDTFYPEMASTGQLMTELCDYLQEFFEITVIVGIPKYGVDYSSKYKDNTFYFEERGGIKIIRVHTPKVDKTSKISRIKFILVHALNAFRATFKADKPDIIYVISQPPILGGVIGRLAKLFRGGKLIYNIQDFNPEQAEVIGYTKSFINRIARAVDNGSIKAADAVVIVGRDMKELLIKRCPKYNKNKIHLINNWIDEKIITPCLRDFQPGNYYKKLYNTEGKFTFMYSGNIGMYYDLENIIKVISEFKTHKDLQFVFVGEGAYKKTLQEYCKANSVNNVNFFSYVEKDKIGYSLNAADVHLVTNQKGIKGVSVPSKIYGVLAVGKPILGVLEKGSEAEQIISSCACGKVSEPQDYIAIKESIQWFYDHKDEAKTMGLKGRTYLENNFKMEDSLAHYKKLLMSDLL